MNYIGGGQAGGGWGGCWGWVGSRRRAIPSTRRQTGGSATEQNGVQDFKISRFMDFEISMGFMGFLWISGFLWDFNLWISRFLWDLWDFYGIISVFYGNNWYFTEIIGINILLGISDLGFKQDFSSDFSICVQDFSLLRTPRDKQ